MDIPQIKSTKKMREESSSAIYAIAESIESGYAKLQTVSGFLGNCHRNYIEYEYVGVDQRYVGFKCCALTCAYFDKNQVHYEPYGKGDVPKKIASLQIVDNNPDMKMKFSIKDIKKVFELNDSLLRELKDSTTLFILIISLYDEYEMSIDALVSDLRKFANYIESLA